MNFDEFQDYAAHHIPEYWIVDYQKQVVEQYILTEESPDEYVLLKKAKIGQQLESKAVQGFQIPVEALFDKKVNLGVLKEIMK